MTHRLEPTPALAPFVEYLWATDGRVPVGRMEAALPTGQMHLVFRLSEEPVRILAAVGDGEGRRFRSLVSGARVVPYFREGGGAFSSVGVQFRTGGAGALLGAPASEFEGRHTSLEDVWGAEAVELRERLATLRSGPERLALLRSWLEDHLRLRFAPRPEVSFAVGSLERGDAVERVVRTVGLSHRRLIELFREQVGLSPKTYARVRRFQRALAMVPGMKSWTDLALTAGFSDQSHLVREFGALAGMPPRRYLELWRGSPDPRHLSLERPGQIRSRPSPGE